ncbi:tRNA uridine-5-carboxymethylaminomethyl(34) synthesis GTPase MnmE [Ignatzschineria ureiclastica]|uniref:tRNA modification GTPase MnmE n=1 Tax=Ignatzschineria ureiclastica TaxID=472582 RepID=A0A2U2ADA9_9GAMM|nr:tRNA uridine-5-carboxymethylaminomethyl(34) synthesis GTPase MnmE [Ignatzschineria ureiclastica]PWD80641.1 tRNA uridine-5-carboxymethylaminomethyl(34) synthesis GTPase MnmE [Ignatzschineria ureiclastica]GGZ95594.1 tRNA modification GTPase MnmE [Ignatzschineria ureiclastica]
MLKDQTIAAIATSTAIGGIGIVRISGHDAVKIAQAMTKITEFKPRYAYFSPFLKEDGEVIDEGVVIFYRGPNSFTGEDVIELQGHGGLIVLNRVLNRVLELGATMARRGEFSERAFLNGKLDLVQAEAIHDLIVSQSEAQARAAMNSLTGNFSHRVDALLETLIKMRVYIEAAIDFSEEDIDFISDGNVVSGLENLHQQVSQLLQSAGNGKVLTDGLKVVIAGKPNAGKSSLLNALSGEESAIVTEIEGTTRDVLRERIIIDGVPLSIIDTAGLRETTDRIEAEGIKRAKKEMESADLVLWMHDDNESFVGIDADIEALKIPTIIIHNKADLSGNDISRTESHITISAKDLRGIELVKAAILEYAGFESQEGLFSARERHLQALKRVLQHFDVALGLIGEAVAIELVAEELRLAQIALGEITGEFSSDALLGEIFSNFCIGK